MVLSNFLSCVMPQHCATGATTSTAAPVPNMTIYVADMPSHGRLLFIQKPVYTELVLPKFSYTIS